MAPAPSQYEVTRDGVRILSFTDEPGVLMSSAPRPKGFAPPAHPFLNAKALDAAFEDRVGKLLARARSTREFISLLRAEGFDVTEGP